MAEIPKVLSVTGLRQDAAAVLRRVRGRKQPLIITQRGRAAAVRLSVDAYEWGKRKRQIQLLLARSEQEIAAGKGYGPLAAQPAPGPCRTGSTVLSGEGPTQEDAALSRRNPLILGLLSVSIISLELSWTRIFSAEFFYTFAFLILSLAILGLGLGALALRLFSGLDRDESLPWLLSLTGAAVLAGPPLVFRLGLDFAQTFHSAAMVAKLLLAIALLSSAYLFGGCALALLLRRNHRDIPRLYMADLVGGGLGVLLVIPSMNLLGTPAAAFGCALPVLLAAFLVARRWLRILPAILAIGMLFLGQHGADLLELKREEPAPVIYRHWDAVAKMKILDRGEGLRGLNIDNAANSPVFQFDGNWDRPDSLRFQFNIDVTNLVHRFDACTFLSLGAGGGGDVLQALQAGAAKVHAVEVVPQANWLLTKGPLAAYTGQIYADPRVIVATEDARAYVRRHPQTFDVIYSLSSNTFAALASGAFAMAENYLFTTEAFEDYWKALTPHGFLSMEHQFYMPRLVSEVRDALRHLGVPNPEQHFAIYKLPSLRRHILLLSKDPLTDEIRENAYGAEAFHNEEYLQLLYPPPPGKDAGLIARIVANGWRAEQDSAAINLSPATDSRPYVAQLGLWKNLRLTGLDKITPYEFNGFPLARLLAVVILLVGLLFVVPLTLLPYLRSDERLRTVPWLYFFTIGMAFMMVEVILIQKYTLFVGPSVYGLATILFTLLFCSGLGSRASRSVDDRVPFVAIAGWLLLDIFVFPRLLTILGGLTLPPRMVIVALLVAPLGFAMGMPFPKAGLRVGPLIDWGLAVTGTASVLGSATILLVAFSFGFGVALAVPALLYLVALGMLRRKSAW